MNFKVEYHSSNIRVNPQPSPNEREPNLFSFPNSSSAFNLSTLQPFNLLTLMFKCPNLPISQFFSAQRIFFNSLESNLYGFDLPILIKRQFIDTCNT